MPDTRPHERAIQPLALPALPAAPTVSVAVACYNYGRFLAECLQSCLAQTVRVDQIVVVNDGSTDDSAQVLDALAARHPQILAVHQPNGGMCVATNVALAACTGDVVLLLDADDAMAPQRVEKVLQALRLGVDGQRCGWVHHLLQRFSATQPHLGLWPHYPGDTAPRGWLAPATLQAAHCPVVALTSALAFRREVLAAIGPLDENRIAYQDVQLRTAASLLSPAAWVPEPLTRYRMHGAAASSGSMVSLPQIRGERQRAVRFDAWLRRQLERMAPGAAALWRPLDHQGGFLWLSFLERWLSGEGRDWRLWWKALRHPDTRLGPRQQRLYYGAGALPRPWFVACSRLIFGSSPLKSALRRLLGRA